MKFECPCGHLISDGTDNLPNKAHFIADQDWDRFWDEIDAAVEKSGPSARQKEAAVMRLRSLDLFRLAWQCPSCGRVHLDDASHTVQSFAPEPGDEPMGIFNGRG